MGEDTQNRHSLTCIFPKLKPTTNYDKKEILTTKNMLEKIERDNYGQRNLNVGVYPYL